MIVEENMLSEFRDLDGLCRLKPDLGGGFTYADYPKLLAALSEAAKKPNLSESGRLKPSFTWDYFDLLNEGSDDYPVVALFAYMQLIPALPITRDWIALHHQGAGYACRQVPMIATVLTPKKDIDAGFKSIAKENYYCCGGGFEGPETDKATTERYLSRLAVLGLTCSQQNLLELCESVYPVDATRDALKACFEDIGDLMYLTEDVRAAPTIVFLSANSD